MRRINGSTLGMLLLGACVAPTPAPPPPAPPPAPRPTATPTSAPIAEDWRDRPYSEGDWSYVRQDGASEARFGPILLRCNGGQVRLVWTGAAPGPLTVRTSYGDSARQMGAGAAGAELELAPGDPLLDQIAYSRGRFMLAAGAQELILPAWPELQRVVEDCR